jgi:hypothetical protein
MKLDITSLFLSIKKNPQDSQNYLLLCLSYLHHGMRDSASRSFRQAARIEFRQPHLFLEAFRALTSRPDLLHGFLEFLSVESYITSKAQEVNSIRQIIRLILQELESTPNIPTNIFGYLGYFKNIEEDYETGRAYLERCINNHGNNLFLARTLSESLLGSWNLNSHQHSGVDLSTLGNFEDFAKEATLSTKPLQSQIVNDVDTSALDAIVFLSSDCVYFETLGLAQAISIVETSPSMGLHFHIMNPNENSFNLISKFASLFPQTYLSTSHEVVDYAQAGSWERKTYYASARFCRAASFLSTSNVPIIITDADVLFKRNILSLLDLYKGGDWKTNIDFALMVPFKTMPLVPLYAKFFASFVLVTNTRAARDYLFQVSYFIEKNLARGACWTLDQLALLAVFEARNINMLETNLWEIPYCQSLDHAYAAEETPSDGIIMTSTGEGKFGSNRYTEVVKKHLQKYSFPS